MMYLEKIKYAAKKMIPVILYRYVIIYQYYRSTGRICDLKRPRRYTEKIQWAKLHRLSPEITLLSDKIAVRKWVKEKIGEDYLIPTLGSIYSSAESIDFKSLPKRFVIKANHGCGYNIVVNDREKLDVKKTIQKLDSWLRHNFSYNSFEMQYRTIVPKLYIEKNIREENEKDLPDYKFFCFNGKVFCVYILINTVGDHSKANLGIFDRNFNLLPYYRADFAPITEQLQRPKEWDEMLKIAETLSTGFSHVRVDLYCQNNRVYFGEMTFSTGSGLFKHEPDEFDFILGEQWDFNSGI